MISHLTPKFRKAYSRLPESIKKQAKANYQLWLDDPQHPSLRFKQVHKTPSVYSIRIGIGWRALGIKEGNVIIWFWIGSHEAYDNLVAQL